MPLPCVAVHLDSRPQASSHGYTRNDATDVAMLSEFRMDLELLAMKQPSEA